MMNVILIAHMTIAVATATICLFQIATLQAYIRLMTLSKRMVEDVHAKHNQQFGGGNCQASEDLGSTEKALSSGQEHIERLLTEYNVIMALV
jgi:hypothetical protein